MLLLIAGMAILGFVRPSSARVTQMVVTKVESPTFGGAAFGSVGQYELIQGTITGEVDPSNPQNAVIADIRNAPRNLQGMVSYSSDFQILRPINLAGGNHRILFDLPNRGGATALGLFNGGSGNNKMTSGTPGNGFIMTQGYTLVEGAWDITPPQTAWANHITHDHVTQLTAGRLDVCQRTDTCPKIIELNSENEYWSKGGSLLTTYTRGNDLELEDTPNVRYYLMSSLPHAPGITAGICQQPQNPLTPAPVLRALLVDLDQWATNGTLPPDNRVPQRRDGTLV
jgi:hypothetical protein